MLSSMIMAAAIVSNPYWFNVYQGQRQGGPYTNQTNVGYPMLTFKFAFGVTNKPNFGITFTNQPRGTNYYVVTANGTNALETDYSNESNNVGATTTLTWHWSPPFPPVTNVVQVSSGTNSVTLTNPASAMMFFRLHLTSWTSSELQFTSWPNGGPWAVLTNWNYASNRTPTLAISRL